MVLASGYMGVKVPLIPSCEAAEKKFCGSVEKSDVISCLLNHTHDESIDMSCKSALTAESKKRAMDFDINVNPKKAITSASTSRATTHTSASTQVGFTEKWG